MKTEFLTEKTLGKYLELCEIGSWVHDKLVPNSKSRWRPDYRNDDLMLIVEFDGPRHFTQAKQIIRDWEKDDLYDTLGYRVVRIPYFFQICPDLARFIFDEHCTPTVLEGWKQTYPHGFVDKNAVRPCDFCTLGLRNYNDIMLQHSGPNSIALITSMQLTDIEYQTFTELLTIHDIPFLVESKICDENLNIIDQDDWE